MATLEQKLDKALADNHWFSKEIAPAVAYAKSGDTTFLKGLALGDHWGWHSLIDPLASEVELSDTARRLLDAFAQVSPDLFWTWAHRWSNEADAENRFAIALNEAKRAGLPKKSFIQYFASNCDIEAGGKPRPWTRFFLERASINELADCLKNLKGNTPLLSRVLERRPQDATEAIEIICRSTSIRNLLPDSWVEIGRKIPGKGLELALLGCNAQQAVDDTFTIASALASMSSEMKSRAIAAATALILERHSPDGYDLWCNARDAAVWLLQNEPREKLEVIAEYCAAALSKDKWRRKHQAEYKSEVLAAAVRKFGREALPFLEACFKASQADVQLKAVQLWIAISNEGDDAKLQGYFRSLIASDDLAVVPRAVRTAGDWKCELVEDAIWPLLGSKSKPARDAAGTTLAKLGESRLPKAKELWGERKADTRIATANWLKALGTPKAAQEAKARLEDEEDEDVRDALLMALEKITGQNGGGIEETKGRIRSTVKKAGKSPVPWLDPKKLPAARLTNGEKLPAEWLSYLLYRQSRVKEIRADLEAKPLFALIDRKTSGDLAIAVLNALFGAEMEANDRWALTFAALIGDDRIVPMLRKQIDEWAENMRGKLAEYAVQALALLGSDMALLTVDSMAIRYRSKNKNIGKAATEAFAAAAGARGLTVEELGDLVVPWFGFQPGEPRIIETPKGKIEARISNDFKLSFVDPTTRKKLAKLPDNAPPQVKAEFKEIAASLKEAVKSQLLRLEMLMVRQFRWPVGPWRELFLQHPLLLPFARRLVWASYDEKGSLLKTFRALDDGSLTDNDDESYALPKGGAVGIVHPLEISEAVRNKWIAHLSDYSVEPPFAQLNRTVISAKPEQTSQKFGSDFDNTELNAMTFRGRAEKLGWMRGSVCDAGGINFYWKRFPNSGVDVFIALDGMFIGIGMEEQIELGQFFFVQTGSVKIGSYEYDEPARDDDPRLVRFGDVPPIAFSESLGDLTKISGKGQKGPADA